MRGPEGAAEVIRARLAGGLPAMVAELNDRLGLAGTAAELAPPGALIDGTPRGLIAAQERPELPLDLWPAFLVVAQSMTAQRRIDVVDEGIVYRRRYPVRVFIWARGEAAIDVGAAVDTSDRGFVDTDLRRKRYTLAVVELLLGLQHLGDGTYLDEVSLRESYSDVMLDEDLAATIAASWVQIDVELDELLARTTLGVVGVPVDVDTTGDHPAL